MVVQSFTLLSNCQKFVAGRNNTSKCWFWFYLNKTFEGSRIKNHLCETTFFRRGFSKIQNNSSFKKRNMILVVKLYIPNFCKNIIALLLIVSAFETRSQFKKQSSLFQKKTYFTIIWVFVWLTPCESLTVSGLTKFKYGTMTQQPP